MYGEALGATAKSVLHLQKTRCFKEQKICSNSSTLPAGNDVPWGAGCSSQECSAFAEDPLFGRCRKSCAGTGCRLSELDRLPVSRIFQCELRQAVPISRRFFGPYKKQRGLRNSRSTPAGTASRPFNQNPPSETFSRHLNLESPSKTPSRHLNPESPSETPLHPFNKYSKPIYISKSKVTDISTSRPLSAAFPVSWTAPQSEITTPSYSHSSHRI